MDDLIVVSVKDTGIGLESDQMKHVFEEFFKADSSRHDLESTGLGLPICKRIVEKHGGRMWVESQGKGKGSTFFFTLKPHKRTSGEENILCKQ
jgi:signal transduction histidine kinase